VVDIIASLNVLVVAELVCALLCPSPRFHAVAVNSSTTSSRTEYRHSPLERGGGEVRICLRAPTASTADGLPRERTTRSGLSG